MVLLFAFCIGILIAHLKIAPEPSQPLSECFYYQPRIPYVPYTYTLGTLVDCLSFYESSHNPNAVGKAGEIGCMQFMPSTFQNYCVEQYGLDNDIWNCTIQRECADRMLKDGGLDHWTTASKCL